MEDDDDLNPDPNNWIMANRLLLPEMTSNGFPVPSRPNYNPNSPPRSDADATSSTANSFPFAPVTPDHAKQFENHRCSAMPSFSVQESSSQEKDKLENLLTNEAAENHSNELLQTLWAHQQQQLFHCHCRKITILREATKAST
ncbi:hypothetical protein U1Q18_007923 [Sarracenia purpurea var. burkii]